MESTKKILRDYYVNPFKIKSPIYPYQVAYYLDPY